MQFDFGKNWKNFSAAALSDDKINRAREDFNALLGTEKLNRKSFLDIGFGQGLSILFATEAGALTTGCDINPTCSEVLEYNAKKYFPQFSNTVIPVIIGSILTPKIVEDIREKSPDKSGLYDVVHSWGVLHHTGNMYKAIENSISLVKPGGGIFCIAIYNKHWSSPLWKFIKWFYCKSPVFIQKTMVAIFYPVIWFAKLLVIRKNPTRQQRGMNFYFDIIDWVGGYPYEYASKSEILNYVEGFGFTCVKSIPAEVPTGCNQFIFIRK